MYLSFPSCSPSLPPSLYSTSLKLKLGFWIRHCDFCEVYLYRQQTLSHFHMFRFYNSLCGAEGLVYIAAFAVLRSSYILVHHCSGNRTSSKSSSSSSTRSSFWNRTFLTMEHTFLSFSFQVYIIMLRYLRRIILLQVYILPISTNDMKVVNIVTIMLGRNERWVQRCDLSNH